MERRGSIELVRAAQRAGVRDERLLTAIAELPRTGFVPGEYGSSAHADSPVPIPHEQVTTQPSLVAQMVDALALGR